MILTCLFFHCIRSYPVITSTLHHNQKEMRRHAFGTSSKSKRMLGHQASLKRMLGYLQTHIVFACIFGLWHYFQNFWHWKKYHIEEVQIEHCSATGCQRLWFPYLNSWRDCLSWREGIRGSVQWESQWLSQHFALFKILWKSSKEFEQSGTEKSATNKCSSQVS